MCLTMFNCGGYGVIADLIRRAGGGRTILSMDNGILPEDGTAQIGSVALPVGQRVYAEERGEQLVVWITSEPMADAGSAWWELSQARAETGLVPVTLAPPSRIDWDGYDSRLWWDDFGFWCPEDVGMLDGMSAEAVLAACWPGADDAMWQHGRVRISQTVAPFGRGFPGLAPPGDSRLPADVLRRAVAGQPPAHLGLVAAGRPADVPAVVGWSVFGVNESGPGSRSLQISAVLRSWETRFGARLLRIGGDAVLRVLVERPPRTEAAAERVAAEHLAFADECDGLSGYSVSALGEVLIGAPIWSFWWD